MVLKSYFDKRKREIAMCLYIYAYTFPFSHHTLKIYEKIIFLFI